MAPAAEVNLEGARKCGSSAEDGDEVSLEGARVAPAAKDGGAPCGVRLEGARVVSLQPLTTKVYAECDLYNTRSQTALELQNL